MFPLWTSTNERNRNIDITLPVKKSRQVGEAEKAKRALLWTPVVLKQNSPEKLSAPIVL